MSPHDPLCVLADPKGWGKCECRVIRRVREHDALERGQIDVEATRARLLALRAAIDTALSALEAD